MMHLLIHTCHIRTYKAQYLEKQQQKTKKNNKKNSILVYLWVGLFQSIDWVLLWLYGIPFAVLNVSWVWSGGLQDILSNFILSTRSLLLDSDITSTICYKLSRFRTISVPSPIYILILCPGAYSTKMEAMMETKHYYCVYILVVYLSIKWRAS